MPIVNVKGVANPISFPDNMGIEDIKAILQQKFSADMMAKAKGDMSDILAPTQDTIAPYEPTLVERIGSVIGGALKDTGIISDNYGAQRIGRNVSALAELLPVIGDATAGDELGTAVKRGDKFGMAMAVVGAIPVAGDLANKGVRKIRKVFHGTDDADFNSFDLKMFGNNYGTQGEPAIYTTTSSDDASFYGSEILEADVDVTDYEEFKVKDSLREVYDSFESYQDDPFDEWVDSMGHDELINVLDFDNLIGNEARYAKKAGKKGIVADFSGTNGGDVILSFDVIDIKVKP